MVTTHAVLRWALSPSCSVLQTAEPAPPLPESDPASPLATERVALPSNNGQSPPPLPSDDAAPSQDAFANHSKPAAVQPVASLSAAVAGIAPARASARPDAAVAAEQGTGAKRRAQPSAVGGTPKRAKRSVVGRSGALVSKWQSVAKDMEVEEVRACLQASCALHTAS